MENNMNLQENIRKDLEAIDAPIVTEEGMSNEKEEQMHELLVFIIQTLDHEFYTEIQSTDNPIGLIRHKVDQVLNR
jgi:hypothetical protein